MNLIRRCEQNSNLIGNFLFASPSKQKTNLHQEIINTVYIVGNRFVDFADNKFVFTLSSFFSWAEHLSKQRDTKIYLVQAGQGISEKDDIAIKCFIKMRHLQEKLLIRDSVLPAKRAEKYLSHKHYEKNTLISEPIKILDKCYESYLMIDENCADISDHLTGQHIQGALLMEAARQMTLAVTEKFFIADDQRKLISFVSNFVETKFYTYAFPLEIKIRYEIKKCRGSIKQSSQFIVLITFLQNDIPVSEITFDFSVMNKFYVYQKESEAAKLVIDRSTSAGVWHYDQAIAA